VTYAVVAGEDGLKELGLATGDSLEHEAEVIGKVKELATASRRDELRQDVVPRQ